MELNEKKGILTIKIRKDVISRLKKVVFYTPGMTLGDFCEPLIDLELNKYNDIIGDEGMEYLPRGKRLKLDVD